MLPTAAINFPLVLNLTYMAFGLVVAYVYIKRNKMEKGLKDADRLPLPTMKFSGFIIFVLAAMWPVILFALLLDVKSTQGKSRSTDQSHPNDTSSK